MRIAYSLPFTNYDDTSRELDSTDLDIALAVYSLGKKEILKQIYSLPSERIASFHGPNLPLTMPNVSALKKAADIALGLGQDSMVLHPHKAKGADEDERIRQQQEALKCIEAVTDFTGCAIAVETFRGKNRVLRPSEILEFNLPLVLDTSHLEGLEIYELLVGNMMPHTVHLSERKNEGLHQQIGVFGESVVELMRQKKWEGALCLEYMPVLRAEARRDAGYLRHALEGVENSSQGLLHYAEENFRNAVEARPDGYLGNYGLGMVLVRKGEYTEAIGHLERSRDIYPAHSATLLFLSYAKHAVGKHEEAAALEQRCKELRPNQGENLICTQYLS